MKFIKKTLLTSSKPSLNISALCVNNNQNNPDGKINHLEEELYLQYQRLKSQVKNIKHLPKYQAYLQSFETLLDNKNNVLNKKIETLIKTLHFNGKKKQKQIPLLKAFLDFSLVERYKFLIDLLKHAEQHQKACQKEKSQSPYNSPSKRKVQQIEQSRMKIISEASISLNQLKAMSLSYWTKVNFELSCQKRQIKVTGKQSFILYLQNYLIRVSKTQKHCFILMCCNPDQVPSWLRKVYIHVKKEIFVEVFQNIWSEIIKIQLEKMQASFQDVNKDVQCSPTKSVTASSVNQDQFQIDKDDYLVFLTPLIVKNYFSDKARFLAKTKNKMKLSMYKEVEFNTGESEAIGQKLEKITFSKAFDQKSKEIFQVKGHFNIPASVVKFKFIHSLKERNKFITSWEILQNDQLNSMQAISQSFDFSSLFGDETSLSNAQVFKSKQLSLKQETSNFSNDQQQQILTLQSIKQISKTSVINFMVVECEQKKRQRCQLIITCEFNKHLIKSKLNKTKIEYISKANIQEMTRKLIENFMKEMVLMIFTQEKMYQEKRIHDEQEFFTICEAFNNQVDDFQVYSSKTIRLEEEFMAEENENQGMKNVGETGRVNYVGKEGGLDSPSKLKKSSSLNGNDKPSGMNQRTQPKDLNLKKTNSLNFNSQQDIQNEKTNAVDQHPQTLLNPSQYLKTTFSLSPSSKPPKPQLVQKSLLTQQWTRLEEGGLTCTNEKKIKEQKQIIKKILVKFGENLLKQKNIMHVSLPVTIFKTESQLTTVARGLTYAPLLLQPQCHMNKEHTSIDPIERVKNCVLFLISNNYLQINFQKPFNPILGETVQYWIDGCPVYFQQISHHPPITYYYLLGRGYKIYGAMEPILSMGINHAKVTSHTVDNILFDDGTKVNAGANRMLVNGTTFGTRAFNLDQKNYIFDSTNNLLAVFSYGATKKRLFTTSNQPSDYLTGKIMKTTQHFTTHQYTKWKTSDLSIKKQWVLQQLSTFQGIWSKKIYFDGEEVIDFQRDLPCELVEEQNPLPSDSRYREDLRRLVEGRVEKAQEEKERMEEEQRRDKKLRGNNHKHNIKEHSHNNR